MAPRPSIINLGLPRTGTTSLHAAAERLGLKSLHIWAAGEHDPATRARLERSEGPERTFLRGFDVLGDTPFYALRPVLERVFPDARLIATVRPREDWIRSMIAHGRAGGAFLCQHYALPPLPHQEASRDALAAAYDRHYAEVAHDLPKIDLAADDHHERWQLLCSALPDAAARLARVANDAWPHVNPSGR